jgi:ATP-dependent exoDNAse (exonuclease V) beta subunit
VRTRSIDHVDAGIEATLPTDAPVEFHFIEKDDKALVAADDAEENDVTNDDELQGDEQESKPDKPWDPYAEAEVEAHPKAVHIANTILAMRRDTEFKDFKDYVVLVRSNAIKAQLKAVFEEANIPHHISVKSGFYNSDAVQDALLLMNFLVNPYDNINLTGTLVVGVYWDDQERFGSLKTGNPQVRILLGELIDICAGRT